MSAVSFRGFCRRLKVNLTRAQSVLVAVCFDCEEPSSLPPGERELAHTLFGEGLQEIPPEARHVVLWKKGARVGGTYLAALRALHQALTLPLTTLAPGEHAFGVIVAPDMRLARQALRYILGACSRHPELQGAIVSETADSVTLRRDDGHIVTIECLPATRGGSALRGRSLFIAILSECAFFRDESYVVNDLELYKSVAPRVLPGGQIVIESTPWTQAGLLHELYRANWSEPATCIAAHCPTEVMRDDRSTLAMVARERQRDPDNAIREYDAQFMSAGTGAFFDGAAVDAAVDSSVALPIARRERAFVAIGADFAFRTDSSSLVVVQRVGTDYFVDLVEELKPTKGKPLVPSEVVATFAGIAGRYGERFVMADGHYRQAIDEHLRAHGVSLISAPEGANGKAESYVQARSLLNEGRVRLPLHARLQRQLKETVATPTAGGGLSISSPRWRTGGHGDLVSSLVLALYRASRQYTEPRKASEMPAPGTPEFAAAWQKRAVDSIVRRRNEVRRRGFWPARG